MTHSPMTIRRSPFLFLKRLVFIEFFFAFLPFIAAVIYNFFGDLSTLYQPLFLATSIPFYLFLVLLVTSLQIAIVIIAFVSWYVPVYSIDQERITHLRGGLLGERRLIDLADIDEIWAKQGPLGKRFDYGSLHLSSRSAQDEVRMSDIPDPAKYVDSLVSLAKDSAVGSFFEENPTAAQIISQGERQQVEFKSSLVWDYQRRRANKELNFPVMKTLAAFMNSSGGYLLIGVADDGEVLGLEPDLQTMRSPTLDAFEISFNMVFNKMIGAEFREYVDITFPELEDRPVCLIRVHRSPHPVYLADKGAEKFYIRAGNASQSLTISQANRYIQRRF